MSKTITGTYLSIEGEVVSYSSFELCEAIEKIERQLKDRELQDDNKVFEKFPCEEDEWLDDFFDTEETERSRQAKQYAKELKKQRISEGFIREYEFEKGGGKLIKGLEAAPFGKIETTEVYNELTFDEATGDDGSSKGLTKVIVTIF